MNEKEKEGDGICILSLGSSSPLRQYMTTDLFFQ